MFKKFFVKSDAKSGTISSYNPKTGETKIMREISESVSIPTKQYVTLSPEKIQKAQNDADWILHTVFGK